MDSFHCSSGQGCATKGEKPAALPEPGICTECLQDAEDKLADLPHLALALTSFLGGIPGVGMEGKISGTSDPGTPLNLHIADLISDIGKVLRVPEFEEIRRVWKRASEQTGLYEKWETKPFPCPICQEKALARKVGTERVQCRECSWNISADKWHGLCAAVIETEKNV